VHRRESDDMTSREHGHVERWPSPCVVVPLAVVACDRYCQKGVQIRPVKRCEQRPIDPAWRATATHTGTTTKVEGAGGRTGRSEGFDRRLDPRVGPLHRETAWLGVGLRARTIAYNPRAPPDVRAFLPPTPTVDRGGGWERVRRDRRVEGSPEAATQSER
jgi:hypothetical protein